MKRQNDYAEVVGASNKRVTKRQRFPAELEKGRLLLAIEPS